MHRQRTGENIYANICVHNDKDNVYPIKNSEQRKLLF